MTKREVVAFLAGLSLAAVVGAAWPKPPRTMGAQELHYLNVLSQKQNAELSKLAHIDQQMQLPSDLVDGHGNPIPVLPVARP